MKQGLFITILFFLIAKAGAQSYYPIAEQNKIWNKCIDIYPHGITTHLEYLYKTDSILISDSLINSQIFVKGNGYWDWTYANTLTEDTINRKVYLDGTLRYDFNMNIGDTIFFGFNDTLFYACYDVDSVVVNATYRKRIFISTNDIYYYVMPATTTWIEGIGDGSVSLSSVGINGGGTLAGVYSNGQLIYQSSNNCHGLVGVNEFDLESFKIFPNPASNQIEISLPPDVVSKHEQLQFQLYEVTGKAIHTQTITSEKTLLSVAHLPQGIYYWRISAASQQLQQGRLARH